VLQYGGFIESKLSAKCGTGEEGRRQKAESKKQKAWLAIDLQPELS
jgi:hypothetical protein